MSSGVVSSLTRITLSPLPFFPSSFATSEVNTTFPAAAPGEAGNPSPNTSPFFNDSASNIGCSNWSSALASILITASSSLIMPSSTKSQAICKAACAVLLPFLVCKKYNFPS